MHLRKIASQKMEVSLDEPLNTDWDGNERVSKSSQHSLPLGGLYRIVQFGKPEGQRLSPTYCLTFYKRKKKTTSEVSV